MLHIENINGNGEHGPLASDVQRLIRLVGTWAADRPLLLDVSLFGQRIRPNHKGAHPVQIAVRFDDARLTDGFDDWIEQLRTNFASLATSLGEPVSVTTPDMRAAWLAIVNGTELDALGAGKVRIITALVRQSAEPVRPKTPTHQTIGLGWSALWNTVAATTRRRQPAV